MEVKVVVVGCGGAGKSPFIIKFIQNQFRDIWEPSLGDTYVKQINVDGEMVLLNITDTPAQEEYSALRDMFLQTGDVFILMYSIINRRSFEESKKLYKTILRIKETDHFPVVFVGNRCDLEQERQVSTSEGRKFACFIRNPFFETSAKNGLNINEVFIECARIGLLNSIESKIIDLERRKTDLKPWQFYRRSKIDKELKQAFLCKESIPIKRRKHNFEEELNSTPIISPAPSFSVSQSTLIQDFRNLMTQTESSDCIIEVGKGLSPFYVHKNFLKLRCPKLFSIMEMKNGVGKLPHFSHSTFTFFLEYIYTGTISTKEKQILDELTEIGELLQLPLLSKLCLDPSLALRSENELKKEIAECFHKPLFQDVGFHIIDGQSDNEEKPNERIFHFDKFILSARCPWFHSCFYHQWKESTRGVIEIKEMEPDVFQSLVEYIYTDTIPEAKYSPDILTQLISVADQLNLLRLKEICESLLPPFIDSDSVLPLYKQCLLHNATHLEKICFYLMHQPDIFPLIKFQPQFNSLDLLIQKELEINYQNNLTILKKRNHLSELIQECEESLTNLSKNAIKK